MLRALPFAAVVVWAISSADFANAQYFTTYYTPTTAYYQPTTVYYAPAAPAVTTVSYAPATSDPCCYGGTQTAVSTTVRYAPAATTTYYAPATTTYYAPATTTAYYAPAAPVVYYPVVARPRPFFRWW